MECDKDKMQGAIFRFLMGQETPEDHACIDELDRRIKAGELPRGSTGPMPLGIKGYCGNDGPQLCGPKGS